MKNSHFRAILKAEFLLFFRRETVLDIQRLSQHTGGKRKKDYVTVFALFLFALLIVFQIALVTWVPRHMRSETLMEREIAYQELVGLLDELRPEVEAARKIESVSDSEVLLAKNALDIIANYMRENGEHMDRDQIRDIYRTLNGYEKILNHWKKLKTGYVNQEKLDVSASINAAISKADGI